MPAAECLRTIAKLPLLELVSTYCASPIARTAAGNKIEHKHATPPNHAAAGRPGNILQETNRDKIEWFIRTFFWNLGQLSGSYQLTSPWGMDDSAIPAVVCKL